MTLKRKFTITRTIKVEGEPDNLNERLIWLRWDKGLRQQEMADLIGCTRSNYTNKETSGHGWSYEQLKIVAIEFNLNMNWLYFGEGRPYLAKPRKSE